VLSRREQQVLELLAEGCTYRGIAERLFIAPTTAKTHVANLLEHLEAVNTPHAVSLGYRYGLLRVRRPIENVKGPDTMRWSA
jgi:DNA-binding NarL/FixJ family response regulator